ncbi:MAG: tRNA (guanosine(46)-N7)-methyltransferase TrmB [Alphaproteobacteria bacterium]|nr:tRNA (guanosine(46)-N7)-methyltransferase TrmB [Alphaproteobacteria bacterium]
MSEFIKSFVKRGRKLSENKSDLLNNFLPTVKISPDHLSELPKDKKINMEIGFGNGKFLENISSKNKNEVFIGCDPYIQGTVNLLDHIKENNIENIMLWNDDARLLLVEMPNNFLNDVFILFPDPWPKARHHKRRIINTSMLQLLAKKMKENNYLYIATDHEDYREWIIETLSMNKNFVENSETKWKKEIFGEIETYYQKKAKDKNIISSFMSFKLLK